MLEYKFEIQGYRALNSLLKGVVVEILDVESRFNDREYETKAYILGYLVIVRNLSKVKVDSLGDHF